MPRTQQYFVDLSANEQAELNAMLSAGTYKRGNYACTASHCACVPAALRPSRGQ